MEKLTVIVSRNGESVLVSKLEFEEWKSDVTPTMAMLYSAKEDFVQQGLSKEDMATVIMKVLEEELLA